MRKTGTVVCILRNHSYRHPIPAMHCWQRTCPMRQWTMPRWPAVVTTRSLLSNSRAFHSRRLITCQDSATARGRNTRWPPQQGKASHRRTTRVWQLYTVLESLASLAEQTFLTLSTLNLGYHSHSYRPAINYQMLRKAVAVWMLLVFLNQSGDFKHKSKSSSTL